LLAGKSTQRKTHEIPVRHQLGEKIEIFLAKLAQN